MSPPFKLLPRDPRWRTAREAGLTAWCMEKIKLGAISYVTFILPFWASIFLCTRKMMGLINNAGHIIINLKAIV